MKTIHKIEATEHLLQVHYYQFFNTKPFSLNSDYDIDINGLNEKYPGFLENFDFSNVDVHDLHKFTRIENRSWDYVDFNLPKYFFCFWKKNIEDLFNIGEFEKFPLLFTEYKSSPFNDLMQFNYYDIICVFNQNGEFLNISVSPNLYDDGYCELTFLNKEYFVISFYDDNNGDHIFLFKYVEGNIESHVDIDSIELINLLDENSIIWNIDNLSVELKNNKSVILKAIKSGVLNIHLEDLFKKDKQIVLELVERNSSYFVEADYSLKIDYSFILEAIKRNELVFQYIDVLFKSDKDFVLKAVKKNGKVLQYVDDSYKAKKDVVFDAVIENGLALEFASATLQDDKELAIEAVKNNGRAFEFVSATLQADKEVALEAIKRYPWSLKFASTSLQDDKEIAIAAVNKNGMSLKFASSSLQADKQVVLQAIKNDYHAFQYCSKLLRNDVDFICEAYKLNLNIMNYINATKIKHHKRLQELFDDYKSREEEQEEHDDLPF
jgi:predicted  nucleic acid-binding Zn-ribbon protein